jgi:hypothetical protein
VGLTLFFVTCGMGWAYAPPALRIRIPNAKVGIYVASPKQECRLRAQWDGKEVFDSGTMACAGLGSAIQTTMASFTLRQSPSLRLDVPEALPLAIHLDKGQITSYRPLSLLDEFTVAQGQVILADHPDSMSALDPKRIMVLDLDRALQEIRSSTP